MAIQSVDMSKALNNEAYAAQVIRSGRLEPGQRSQLESHWGSDKITQWESVDSTQYEIDDTQKSEAKKDGKEKIEESGGDKSDGKADNGESKAGSVVAIAGTATGIAANIVAAKALVSKKLNGFAMAIGGGAMLAGASALRALDANKEQVQALDNLAPVMTDSQGELQDASDTVSETTNDLTDASDKLSEVSEETNKTTEEKQKEYAQLQARYNELVSKYEASKTGGDKLTNSEKAEMKMLGEQLPEMFEELGGIKEEGDEKVKEHKEALEDAQETYDDAAGKMEEVKTITDYSAGFDEDTVDNAKLVKTVATVGKYSAGAMAITGGVILSKAIAKNVATWGGNTAEVIAAGVGIAANAGSAAIFNNEESIQSKRLAQAQSGVENRKATEEVYDTVQESYDKDLDTYADNIDFTDEIEIKETDAKETTIVDTSEKVKSGDEQNEQGINTPSVPGVQTQNNQGVMNRNAGVNQQNNPFASDGAGGKVDNNPFAAKGSAASNGAKGSNETEGSKVAEDSNKHNNKIDKKEDE